MCMKIYRPHCIPLRRKQAIALTQEDVVEAVMNYVNKQVAIWRAMCFPRWPARPMSSIEPCEIINDDLEVPDVN